MDETVQKALQNIKRNTDRLDEPDAQQTILSKDLDETPNQVHDDIKKIAFFKQVLGYQKSNVCDVENGLKQGKGLVFSKLLDLEVSHSVVRFDKTLFVII